MHKKLLIFIPHLDIGGVEKNFFLISNFLSKKFDDVSVITINSEFKKKLNKKIKLISPNNNRWKNSSIYTKYVISIFLLIKTLLVNKDYVIFSFQANWYAIIIAKIFGRKIISRSNTAPEGWSKNNFKKILYKYIINLADTILVNSIEFKKNLKKNFNVNAVCIYNPLNRSNILKLSKIRKKINFFKSKKSLRILNIGRLTDQINQLLILKSIRYLKKQIPIKVIIVGKGGNYEVLKNYIRQNNLNDKILLINGINNPYPYIKHCDIFLLSSNYEGLPNVLLEAQCFKKIIISTKCPTGPQEILLNGKAGIFFKMNDFKDLSKKIIYVYKNKNKMINKVNTGYNYLHRFDEKKNLEMYYQVILKHFK